MKIEKNITVCFDSNIYDSTNYDFEGKFYTTFKGLKKSYPNLRVYIEPIIYNEVLSHLRDRAIDITKAVESLSKQTRSLDLFSSAMETLKIEDLESQCFTEYEEKFEEFIKFFSDEEIDKTFNYEMSDILSDYFEGLPPFENKKSKKNEFPDALIIQSLKNKFQNQDNLFIVSSDKGFREAVRKKIPKARTFLKYSECADFLNKQQEKYKEAHKDVENLVDNIKAIIITQFEDLLNDFVLVSYAESLGIKIDVTNYDRKGYSEFFGLDEVMINHLDFNSYRIRILDIDSDKKRIGAEIIFIIDIDISGYEDESNDLILESHKASYSVNVEVKSDSNKIIDISHGSMILNRSSLINRSIERYYFEDYIPSLHPTRDSYSVVCDSCEFCNEFFSPEMGAFEITSSEREMGNETLYYLTINEICQECTQPFIIDISISIYPYLTFNYEEIYCSGGETDLSFELS